MLDTRRQVSALGVRGYDSALDDFRRHRQPLALRLANVRATLVNENVHHSRSALRAHRLARPLGSAALAPGRLHGLPGL